MTRPLRPLRKAGPIAASAMARLPDTNRILPVVHILAVIVIVFALAMLVPLGFSLVYEDGLHELFLGAFAVTLVAGLFSFFATRIRFTRELQPRDGFLLVALVWTVLPAFATIPFLVYLPGLTFTDAYFESVSGLTASGATLLSGLDGLPASINIWRTFLHWLGGMGIIVLAVAILPLLGVGGSQLFKAEFPGCMKDTKLTPRIADTAKGLWGVYVFLTAACVTAYHLAGMSWLDAFAHGFSTMGLGGFSSRDASIGHFNSPAIEAVAIFFMAVATINFSTHFLAVHRRSLTAYAYDAEARRVLIWLAGSSVMIAVFLTWREVYPDFATSLRFAAFNVVSIASTTGFSSTDYAQWPIFAPLWMIFLSCFATSSGSTGGGIKMIRAVLLFKQAIRELTRIIHPRAVVPVKFGEMVIENNVIFAVLAFMLMWGGTIIVMTMLMTASGLDVITSITAVIACINNTGPGLGFVGPASTYAGLTDFQTWICTLTMLLGRLELFALLVLFTPAFWRK